MRLKKQYGRYVKTAIPKTPDCTAPQVFQGTKTEVTVPLSSKVRLRFSGDNPFSLYVSANIFPGIMILKYWSDTVILKNIQVPAVVVTKSPVDLAYSTIGLLTLFNNLVVGDF